MPIGDGHLRFRISDAITPSTVRSTTPRLAGAARNLEADHCGDHGHEDVDCGLFWLRYRLLQRRIQVHSPGVLDTRVTFQSPQRHKQISGQEAAEPQPAPPITFP
jgi:hypothetical protein